MAKRVLIGIAGGTASGKTLVASRIHEAMATRDVAILRQDSYYRDLTGLDAPTRSRQNFDHPDAFDIPLLVEHLESLLGGGEVDEPIYDFTRHARTPETRRIRSGPVVVVEGIMVLVEPRLRELMDIKIYVDTDPDVRLMRRIRRDVQERGRTVESVLDQYEGSVRPMHQQFVEPSKRHADVIIPEGGDNRVAVDLLTTKIAAVLAMAGGAGSAIADSPRTTEPAGSTGPGRPTVKPEAEPANQPAEPVAREEVKDARLQNR